MKHAFQAVPFLVLVYLGVQASHGEDKKPQKIKGAGTFVDPAGDCKVAEKDGKVTITVPGTHHDLNPTPRFDNVTAPRVLQQVEGDFTVQVKVDAFTRPQAKTASSKAGISFVAAGLLIWQDEKNFIRLLRAANGDQGNLFVHLEIYRNGKFAGDAHGFITNDRATYLKVTRKGNGYSFAASLDGKRWIEMKSRAANVLNLDRPKKVVEQPKKLKVGIAAINATTKKFAPAFEGLSLTGK